MYRYVFVPHVIVPKGGVAVLTERQGSAALTENVSRDRGQRCMQAGGNIARLRTTIGATKPMTILKA